MIFLLLSLVKKDMRESFPNALALAGEALALTVSLVIYYYTSKMLDHSISPDHLVPGQSYFEFILIGDVMLFLPVTLIYALNRAIRASNSDGTFEVFLSLPVVPERIFLHFAVSSMPRELLRTAVIFTVAYAAFALAIKPVQLIQALIYMMLWAPAFLGLGMWAAALFVRTGRGSAALDHALTILTLLAGAYFPLHLLPDRLHHLSQVLSPLTAYLQSVRAIVEPGGVTNLGGHLIAPILWSIALFGSGYWLLGRSIEFTRQRGSMLLRP